MVTSTSSKTTADDPADAPLIPKAIANLSLRDDAERMPPMLDRKPTKKLKDASAAITVQNSTHVLHHTWMPATTTSSRSVVDVDHVQHPPPHHHHHQQHHLQPPPLPPLPLQRGPKARKRQQAHSPAVSANTATQEGSEDGSEDDEHSGEVTAAVGALLLGGVGMEGGGMVCMDKEEHGVSLSWLDGASVECKVC